MSDPNDQNENQKTGENKLPVQSGNNLPITDAEAAAANILKRPKRSLPLLRFKKGDYQIGDTIIPAGTEFFVFWTEWKAGWIRWDDGKLTEGPTGRYADGFVVPERPSNEKDLDGNFIWKVQNWLPMESIETGEFCVFVTDTLGGEDAIEEVCGAAAQQVAAGRNRGNPIISLVANVKRPSKKYGQIPRPKFQIIGWENDSGKTATPIVVPPAPTPPKTDAAAAPLGGDMNDEIPF
jgi:hypothetical protein